MILDYNYNSYGKKLDISYIEDNGSKQILSFNVQRFKSFYSTPTGKFTNWAGDKCDIRWVEKPHKFDIKTYITELDDKYKVLLNKRTFPKVYTFDIETKTGPNGEFPEPDEAKYPITNISICSPDLNTIVLGTLKQSDKERETLEQNFTDYLNNTAFFKELNKPMPYVKYVYFPTEEEMLKYFITHIVAKVPILTGWNCILFDWQYITTRIRNYYPNLSVKASSCNYRTSPKRFVDKKGNTINLPMPEHTLILDMMDIIEHEDKKVLPLKESMRLDYIASASMGIHKISYDGSLDDLYENDYGRYVFYNSIDSMLVQLINYRFKTLDHIYLYALYCNEKIASCFSKIALTEALVFNDFYNLGLKIVPEEKEDISAGALIGAYVKIPVPGIHQFVCCNDFASLYPSTIRTCNLSFENFVGAFYDEEKLKLYKSDRGKYIVVGPNVYQNEGTYEKPSIGRLLDTYLNEEKLNQYRNKNYFVSVNGCVYKNDKDYSFRRIQGNLKATRDRDKYMSKQLDAVVMLDVEHVLSGKAKKITTYSKEIVEHIKNMGYAVQSTQDLLYMLERGELGEFKSTLSEEITYLGSNEQAIKLLMNSMYGGASHTSFYWFNMALANDITGESRNLTHMMEHHIPDFMRNNWLKLNDLHKELGIEIDTKIANDILNETPSTGVLSDPDAFHESSFITPVYGDTDSIYSSYENFLKCIKNVDKMSIDQKRDLIVKFNTGFLDNHNREFIADYYKTRFGQSVHNFELETVSLSGAWLNVKKHYSQLLLWKDGKIFDLDHLKMKTVGLEMNKASHPKQARYILEYIVRYMLENANDKYLNQKLNIEIMKKRNEWNEVVIDDVCANINVNGYSKYILYDGPNGLKTAPKCPANVRALGNYNVIASKSGNNVEHLYGGKMKQYEFKTGHGEYDYFAYPAMNYPNWAKNGAPIDRSRMFQKYVLDPLNRIIIPVGLQPLNLDGSIQFSLF